MPNFMIEDLVQTTLATLAFALFLLPSGYLLGIASNAFGMRSRSAAEKLLFSAAFSFVGTPILAVLLARWFSDKVTLVFFLLLALTHCQRSSDRSGLKEDLFPAFGAARGSSSG